MHERRMASLHAHCGAREFRPGQHVRAHNEWMSDSESPSGERECRPDIPMPAFTLTNGGLSSTMHSSCARTC